MNKFARVLVSAGAALSALSARAADATSAVDVSGVVATIQAQASPIALIGGAVLVIIVGVMAFKWVRSALR